MLFGKRKEGKKSMRQYIDFDQKITDLIGDCYVEIMAILDDVENKEKELVTPLQIPVSCDNQEFDVQVKSLKLTDDEDSPLEIRGVRMTDGKDVTFKIDNICNAQIFVIEIYDTLYKELQKSL